MSTLESRPETPDERTLRRWRRYLADERAEASVYRDLASRREGEERDILTALADAESRHEQHWLDLLGPRVGKPLRPGLRSRVYGWLARRLGSVFVLALVQRAESRSPYADDPDATSEMAADEQIHEEVVRALAERGRNRISGTFRAAVFGANDGLVSNLSLVLGVGASGVSTHVILLTGIAGLLAGALSMGAGEFVSVHSQRELLSASTPNPEVGDAIEKLNVNQNELALVFRSRGMTERQARTSAARLIWGMHTNSAALSPEGGSPTDEHEAVGTGMGAALSSFCFFASGAIVPVIPYLFGMSGLGAVAVSAGLVGLALLGTGAVVGLLSGSSPLWRAVRQLAIGYGAAAVTYLLGLLFGTTAG
ncbi:VIT1/CCC1 transporter family protein [Gryllotalpicola koreensis]|uniref:VIT1/CCC1 transporter family protein n=1 Tax=Gryllotalpicola koreensis TaxID=993086 RepID=A0ABP7ZUT9_9MICO